MEVKLVAEIWPASRASADRNVAVKTVPLRSALRAALPLWAQGWTYNAAHWSYTMTTTSTGPIVEADCFALADSAQDGGFVDVRWPLARLEPPKLSSEDRTAHGISGETK